MFLSLLNGFSQNHDNDHALKAIIILPLCQGFGKEIKYYQNTSLPGICAQIVRIHSELRTEN